MFKVVTMLKIRAVKWIAVDILFMSDCRKGHEGVSYSSLLVNIQGGDLSGPGFM